MNCYFAYIYLLRHILIVLFLLLVIILKKQPFAVGVLVIYSLQVLRELLTDIKEIIEVGDVLSVGLSFRSVFFRLDESVPVDVLQNVFVFVVRKRIALL